MNIEKESLVIQKSKVIHFIDMLPDKSNKESNLDLKVKENGMNSMRR